MTVTVGELLGRVLAAHGVDAVYGAPLPGLHVTPAPRGAALLLACAHRRVHGAAAAVHDAGVLRIGDGPEHTIREGADLLDAVPAGALRLEVDPAAPAPDGFPASPVAADGWAEASPGALDRLRHAAAPAVLAGPGVVAEGAVAGLNAFATAGNVGVLNTWGAKGVFHWRSRHHWATVGLQADDFRLGGLVSADLIVATGVDEDEAPPGAWQLADVLPLAPSSLAPLAEEWWRPRGPLSPPPLRTGLAGVTQEGWSALAVPLQPSRVTLHYASVFGGGGLVAADAGVAGYWVARTFGTTQLRSVHVPARAAPGFAVACALVARLLRPGRPVVAAVDRVDEASAGVLDVAASLGIAVPLEVWSPDGGVIDADAHLDRLRRLSLSPAPVPVRVTTDTHQLARMVDVAGPVTAWGGLA